MRLAFRAVALACPLLAWLLLAPSAAGADVVWVRFADHGVLERAPVSLRAAAVRATVSPRSLERRALRGQAGGLFANDLPVEPRYVQALVDRGFRVRVVSRWLNAASLETSPDRLSEIASLPFVAGVEPVARAVKDRDLERPTTILEPSCAAPSSAARARPLDRAPGDTSFYGYSFAQNELIEADRLHARGLSGRGVLVTMLDTGFRETHEAFDSLRVVAHRDFIHGDTVVVNEAGQDGAGQDFHGTMTLSAIGAYLPGRLMGTAFGATFALGKTEDEASETPVEMDYWQAGAEWADSLGADVISSSLGYSTFDSPFPSYTYADLDGRTTVVTLAAAEAARRGIVVVTAQGNSGSTPWHYLIAPADGDTVCAVGATDSMGVVTYFSSFGPSADGRVKPDVCAMGLNVALVSPGSDSTITQANGTSFSTPAMAGVCALLLEAHPGWTPFEVIQSLRATASQFDAPDTHAGYGLARAADAVDWTPSTVFANPAPGAAALVLVGATPTVRGGEIAFWARVGTASGAAAVAIFDTRGRRLRTLFDGDLLPGSERLLSWDGRDEEGRRAAAGVYFVRFDAPGVHLGRRVVLL
jgi:subtilisin family serine protease